MLVGRNTSILLRTAQRGPWNEERNVSDVGFWVGTSMESGDYEVAVYVENREENGRLAETLRIH